MSVERRVLASGTVVYRVRWREGNHNRSRNFDTRDQARDFDKELRRLRQAGELATQLDRRRITVAELTVDWWERRASNKSDATREHYARLLDGRIIPEFGQKKVAQLTVRDIETWISKMRRQGTGNPTILKACAVLQAILTLAVADGIVTVNVVGKARKPRQGRTRVPYLVTPDQVEDIRVRLPEGRDRVLLELLAYAGLRPESEGLRLVWQHVRDRSLLIRDTKRGKERTISLLDPLRETLEDWREQQAYPPPHRVVVLSNQGGEWSGDDWDNWRDRVFRPAAVRAGLPRDIRPRDLRGSFVSLLVHEGRSIVEVARQVGHDPAISLRDYAQIFDDLPPGGVRPEAGQMIRDARYRAHVRYALTTPIYQEATA